ncbi:MAG: hypothetical protein KAX81_04030 [Leadbetterella sp.]|nr:hypothetical protein [Leadbetterella sp.]
MKRNIVLISLILFFANDGFCQEIRTFNTVNFSSTLSKSVNNYSVSVGEMLQVNRTLPFRLLVAAQYTGKITKSGIWPDNTSLNIKKNIFTSNINMPIGAEVYYKNIGLGLAQEIVNFNLAKSFDSTKIKTSQNYEIKTNGFSHVFSNKNNLSSTFYLVYTISDSFSLKAGFNRENEVFNFYEDSNKIGFSKITDNSVFISIRTNIEK